MNKICDSLSQNQPYSPRIRLLFPEKVTFYELFWSAMSNASRKTQENYIGYLILPTRNEKRELLGIASIPVAILPSCQDMKIIAL